jgi:ectoine hydroxylase-related dioxygenase (phytanoyl-CoA dioxygenase family)
MLEEILDLSTGSQEEFKKQGYIIRRGFFSTEDINFLRENIQSSDTKENTFGFDKNRSHYHTAILNRSKKVRELIIQPKVVNLLSKIIGSDIWVRWDQAISKDPGASMMPWHQDNRYTQLKHTSYQVWIPLTKVTAENGALWVQPGQYFLEEKIFPHQYTESFFDCDTALETPIMIEADPGDIVIFSSFLLHCTAPNITNQSRWAYILECLPLHCFDPLIEPPYFLIARDGKPHPEFVQFYAQRLNPINVLKYGWFKLKNVWYALLKPLVRRVLNAKS